MPVSGTPRSWKPHAVNVIAAKAAIQPKRLEPLGWIAAFAAMTSDDNVHQPAGHHHDLLRLLPVDEFLHRLALQGEAFDLLAAGRRGDLQVAAQLAVHLDH